MTEFERKVLAALQGIERALKAPRSPEEGIMTVADAQAILEPQMGAQRLTEGTPVDFAEQARRLAAFGSGEYANPRLVEKLLNPEGH
jgi:hypothetical protein